MIFFLIFLVATPFPSDSNVKCPQDFVNGHKLKDIIKKINWGNKTYLWGLYGHTNTCFLTQDDLISVNPWVNHFIT